MTTQTTVTWNPLPAVENQTIMKDQIITMTAQGKTDNMPVHTWPSGEGTAPCIVVRQWTTLQDAQEWVNFITPYNPQSAVINS